MQGKAAAQNKMTMSRRFSDPTNTMPAKLRTSIVGGGHCKPDGKVSLSDGGERVVSDDEIKHLATTARRKRPRTLGCALHAAGGSMSTTMVDKQQPLMRLVSQEFTSTETAVDSSGASNTTAASVLSHCPETHRDSLGSTVSLDSAQEDFLRNCKDSDTSVVAASNVLAVGTKDDVACGVATLTRMDSPVRSVVSCDMDEGLPTSEKAEIVTQPEIPGDIKTEELAAVCNLHCAGKQESSLLSSATALPVATILHDPCLLELHLSSVRLESSLLPLRPLLSRLMFHQTFNRRGTFNAPVDATALGLMDYHTIVKQPMDLGTVKARLHALSYRGHTEVTRDVRLTFENAMAYNPPGHVVHAAAKALLELWDAGYAALFPSETPQSSTTLNPLSMPPASFDMVPNALSMNADTVPHRSVAAPLTPIPVAPSFVPAPIPAAPSVAPGPTEASSVLPPPPLYSAAADFPEPPRMPSKKLHHSPAVLHSCSACHGRTCLLCLRGCLCHEPSLLLCAGAACHGAKIRKHAAYYAAPDGSRLWCQRCYSNLCAVLPESGGSDELGCDQGQVVRYKRDLLKRKNEEEVVEKWLNCKECKQGVHAVCAMYDCSSGRESADFVCPLCVVSRKEPQDSFVRSSLMDSGPEGDIKTQDQDTLSPSVQGRYTFISGSEAPVFYESPPGAALHQQQLDAESLPKCAISTFIEGKVRDRMVNDGCPPHAEKSVHIRVVSNCTKSFRVPEVVQRHFCMSEETEHAVGGDASCSDGKDTSALDGPGRKRKRSAPSVSSKRGAAPVPELVAYNSKAIALFQTIDGLDVCTFFMYVHEYDAESAKDEDKKPDITFAGQRKRVYIAYIDSVEHFRPRYCRTHAYQEILVSYLATARARGFENAHIWACPPRRGNSFVFWNHPASQRTPTGDRLERWYHSTLARAVECGIVTNVRSLYEHAFEKNECREMPTHEADSETDSDGVALCPPLLDGDFWIEESSRIRAAALARHLKMKPPKARDASIPISPLRLTGAFCPALEVASLLSDRIMVHPLAGPFLRPVNAAALNLRDYHAIITRPMDLGTVHARCVLGEFEHLHQVVSDVELVFVNAMRYNPKGHFVHNMALEVRDSFRSELDSLADLWNTKGNALVWPDGIGANDVALVPDQRSWARYHNLSMRLDVVVGVLELGDAVAGPVSSKTPMPSSPTKKAEVCSAASSSCSAQDVSSSAVAAAAHPSSKFALMSAMYRNRQLAAEVTATLSHKHPKKASPRSRGKAAVPVPKKLNLLADGPDAVAQCMAGSDTWLLDKRATGPPSCASGGPTKKKGGGSKKKRPSSSAAVPPSCGTKQRRQTWLSEEVGATIRRMRLDFFVCDLNRCGMVSRSEEEKAKLDEYDSYVKDFVSVASGCGLNGLGEDDAPPRVADSRQALLEFSQYHNLEFDTLRRAKHSTAVLLRLLHTPNTSDLVPRCTRCFGDIENVRWHKVKKPAVHEQKQCPRFVGSGLAQASAAANYPALIEELCIECYGAVENPEDFIPLRVSFHKQKPLRQ